jgi:hypothetical protein
MTFTFFPWKSVQKQLNKSKNRSIPPTLFKPSQPCPQPNFIADLQLSYSLSTSLRTNSRSQNNFTFPILCPYVQTNGNKIALHSQYNVLAYRQSVTKSVYTHNIMSLRAQSRPQNKFTLPMLCSYAQTVGQKLSLHTHTCVLTHVTK